MSELLIEGGDLRDLPPEAEALAALLAAAKAPGLDDYLSQEAAFVPALAAAARDTGEGASPERAYHPRSRRVRARLRVAAVGFAALIVVSGALASFGALPGAAQQVAHDVLAKIGLSVPAPNQHAGEHPNTRGVSGDHPSPHATASPQSHPPATHGNHSNQASPHATPPQSPPGNPHQGPPSAVPTAHSTHANQQGPGR